MSAFVSVLTTPTQPSAFYDTSVCGSIPAALPRVRVSGRRPVTQGERTGLRLLSSARSGAVQRATPTMVSSTALDVAKFLAGPCINIFNFVMIVRIILTWYPKTDLAKSPWIFIAVPTEPLLRATRKVIQPVGGVDISPIVWFAIMSFVHEILVGPQGLLNLLSQK